MTNQLNVYDGFLVAVLRALVLCKKYYQIYVFLVGWGGGGGFKNRSSLTISMPLSPTIVKNYTDQLDNFCVHPRLTKNRAMSENAQNYPRTNTAHFCLTSVMRCT